MTDSFTPIMRALVAATLLLATAAMMIVVVNNARAARCACRWKLRRFRQVVRFSQRRRRPQQRLVPLLWTGLPGGCERAPGLCAALAVDFVNPCASHGWGKAGDLGPGQSAALKSCYRTGGKECVIRTFFCDAKG